MNRTYTGSELPYHTPNVAQAFSLYIGGSPFADDSAPLTNTYDAEILHRLGFPPGTGTIEEAAHLAVAANKKGAVEYGFKIDHDLGPNIEAFDEYQKLVAGSAEPASGIVASINKRCAGGELSRGMALCAAACVVVKRWRDELKEWETKRAFTARRQKNIVNHYDAREAAEAAFLAGDFYPLAAVLMDARPLFIALWRRYPPMIRLRRVGAASFKDIEDSHGKPGKLGKFPGFAAHSAHASNETRRHLGVPIL